MLTIVYFNIFNSAPARIKIEDYYVWFNKKTKQYIINACRPEGKDLFTIGVYDSYQKACYVFTELVNAEQSQSFGKTLIYSVPTNDVLNLKESKIFTSEDLKISSEKGD